MLWFIFRGKYQVINLPPPLIFGCCDFISIRASLKLHISCFSKFLLKGGIADFQSFIEYIFALNIYIKYIFKKGENIFSYLHLFSFYLFILFIRIILDLTLFHLLNNWSNLQPFWFSVVSLSYVWTVGVMAIFFITYGIFQIDAWIIFWLVYQSYFALDALWRGFLKLFG
jgi:hypothetical protein